METEKEKSEKRDFEREERSAEAKKHDLFMRGLLESRTRKSVEKTAVLKDTEILVVATDTVTAIEMTEEKDAECGRVAALNFASYTTPGGGFLSGAVAQEECLCMESNLYEILSDEKNIPFYEYNRKHINNGLYMNRALMSPGVIFRNKYPCDILTCAAPNWNRAKAEGIGYRENYRVLNERCRFILECFEQSGANTIILGAFGCGVFGQNPEIVAHVFRKLLEDRFRNVFQKVIFAVPESRDHVNTNLNAFITEFETVL